MGKKHRPQMLGEEIRKIISNLLIFGRLKDPVFSNMVSVSGVDVSGDSSYATVYVTALALGTASGPDEETKKEILAAFERSKGFIRTEIAKNIKLRYAPELSFKFDNSFEYGAKMDALIDSLDIKPADPEDTDDF